MEIGVLRQVLKSRKYWQHLEGEVHAPRERRGIGKALSPEEESRLLDECRKADSACYAAAVLALNTAMRSGEIRRLKWEQIDLANRILTVGKSKTEAGERRAIPLNQADLLALEEWGGGFHTPRVAFSPHFHEYIRHRVKSGVRTMFQHGLPSQRNW